jgi:hypothetical protein
MKRSFDLNDSLKRSFKSREGSKKSAKSPPVATGERQLKSTGQAVRFRRNRHAAALTPIPARMSDDGSGTVVSSSISEN